MTNGVEPLVVERRRTPVRGPYVVSFEGQKYAIYPERVRTGGPRRGLKIAVCPNVLHWEPAQIEANARLLAASWEMLAALQAVLRVPQAGPWLARAEGLPVAGKKGKRAPSLYATIDGLVQRLWGDEPWAEKP